MDNAPKWLFPACVIVMIAVLAIDLSIKNALLREARELERIIKDGRGQYAPVGTANGKRDNPGRFAAADVVGGNASVEKADDNSPVASEDPGED